MLFEPKDWCDSYPYQFIGKRIPCPSCGQLELAVQEVLEGKRIRELDED
jgi:hypothetical protein